MGKSGRCVCSHKCSLFLQGRSIQNPFTQNFAAHSVLLLSVVILCQGMMCSLFECMWVLVCIYVCLYAFLCVTICVYMHVYMYVYLCVYVCLYVYNHVSVCMCMPVCLCEFISMHVHLYMYIFNAGDGIHRLPNARQMLYLWTTYTETFLTSIILFHCGTRSHYLS